MLTTKTKQNTVISYQRFLLEATMFYPFHSPSFLCCFESKLWAFSSSSVVIALLGTSSSWCDNICPKLLPKPFWACPLCGYENLKVFLCTLNTPLQEKAHFRTRQSGLPRSCWLGQVHLSCPTRNCLWVNCLSYFPSDFDYVSLIHLVFSCSYFISLWEEKKNKLFYFVPENTTYYSFFSK